MPKLIIWDLDGTLVDSLPATLLAFNDALEPLFKRKLSDQEIMAHFGTGEHEIFRKILGPSLASHVDSIYQTYLTSIHSRLTSMLLFDGVPAVLENLSSKGTPMAVFTGRGKEGTKKILSHHGLSERLAEVVTHDDCLHGKPSPEGILKICSKLNILPADAVMIGDSTIDILSAKHAGSRAIGCTWDARSKPDALRSAGADIVTAHPRELLEAIRSTRRN